VPFAIVTATVLRSPSESANAPDVSASSGPATSHCSAPPPTLTVPSADWKPSASPALEKRMSSTFVAAM